MKNLDEIFNLPPLKEEVIDPVNDPKEETIETQSLEAYTETIDKIEAALPEVKGLEASDAEMDQLAADAHNTYKDLVDLGMNVDVRSSARLFEVAATMLGHAITAKTAKVDKKLRMIALQLKKQQLEQQKQAQNNTPIEGKGIPMSRNALLEEILAKTKDAIKKDK